MLGNKTNGRIERLKCLAHDEGFGIEPIDYGVRITSKNGNFLLDIWAKHNKRKELLHYTVHEWNGDRWRQIDTTEEIDELILQYKQFLYSPRPGRVPHTRVVQKWRRY